jgi:hypothetical protein
MKNKIKYLNLLTLSLLILTTACKDSGSNGPEPVTATLVTDIQANVNTTFSPSEPATDIEGNTDSNPGFTFYDLDTGSIVEDSMASTWDIAFAGTTILANAGNGGGLQILDTSYPDLQNAPVDGYADNIGGSGSWYTYTAEIPGFPPHAILSNTDKTIVVKTTDGRYAKLQILSYYKGNPDTSTPEFANFMSRPPSSYFTFNYLIQTTSSTELYHEDTFTYFDFETESLIEDSTSSQWDIGLKGTTIIANAANEGGVQLLNIPFINVTEAPIEGYSENVSGWYTYTGEAPSGPKHAIIPTEGITLVFKTGNGLFSKVRILNYYKGNPDLNSAAFANFSTRPASRYYTFEFAVQSDGSSLFE